MKLGETKRRLYDAARDRLRERLCSLPGVVLSTGGGAEPWTANLGAGISADETASAYSADPAWREDLALPHSSAALTVNLFAPWQADLDQLRLAGQSGFKSLKFEIDAPIGLDGTPAYFDAFGTSDRCSTAVEVKCLEYLSEPSEKYRVGFEQSIRQLCDAHGFSNQGWLGQANLLNRDRESYQALFAHQLVKQAFALAHHPRPGRHLLLYLYWEPLDWRKHEFFERHRLELGRLSEAVADERIGFQYQSVPELIGTWAEYARPDWLDEHVRFLKHRYEVEIGET